jgi:hypothetical protein
MSRIRLIISIVFSTGVLFVSSLYFLSFYHLVPPGLDKGSSIIAIVLSVIAFVFSLRIKSLSVGGLLTLGGILMQIPPVQAIISAGRILVPGPILGVISFCPVLILGLAKLSLSRTKNIPPKTSSVQVNEKKDLQTVWLYS